MTQKWLHMSLTMLLVLEAILLTLLVLWQGDQVTADMLEWFSLVLPPFFLLHLTFLAILPGIGVVSAPFLYGLLMFLYMCSVYILFSVVGELGFVYYRFISQEYFARSAPILMLSVVGFVLGVLLATLPGRARSAAQQQRTHILRPRLEYVTTILAVSLLAFSILIILRDTAAGRGLAPMLQGNYHVYSELQATGQQSRFFIASMTWFIPIASLTLVAMQKSRTRRMGWADAVLFVSLVPIFIAGDRGTMLGVVIGWLIMQQTLCRNVTGVKLVTIGVLMMVFVPIMEVLRGLSAADWSLSLFLGSVTTIADTNFEGSLLLTVLGPFSSSVQTMKATLLRVDLGEPIRFGTDYIGNILAAIPFNSSAAPNNSQQVHDYLFPGQRGGPGYMAAAEMYFNFHIPGVMLGHILLGYMIGRIHQTLAHLQANAHYLAATAVFFFTCLIWIRNEMSYVTQIMFLWGVLFWLMPRIGKTLMPWKSAREVRTVSAQ